MALTFTLDPTLDRGLKSDIVRLWTDVSNAGGAVGFVPPVTEDDVWDTAERQFAGVAPQGPDRLLVAHESGTGRLVGLLFFESTRYEIMDHWRSLRSVMVHPDLQGLGRGAELLAEAERIARAWGLQSLRLTLRGGQGLERFYGRAGYQEVGRVPAAIRVAPGDDRDDVTMWLDLR
ncbi:GNAT family N-acetyltransferase [Streptomyces rubellomurinus]|uniref:Acetyltransferase n=2 Tax=Streptomyces TaxID=1883 RepID=A0A0F2TMI8_STRR3|nr:GNAT family N-acetyltransferase [Streptomyces rubellomurinus]KJS54607.1 acetyltransferase [Streptomyces rubellomurinus subsp. indigoferus]KJS63490.1 acetyltransferase [Streptomyces rubellomurinus]